MIIATHILFGLMIVFGVAIVIYTKNLVHAAYALALALVGLAGIYVLLSSELLAIVQVLLYAGGVIILIIFGIMMTNRARGTKVISASKNIVLGAVISSLIFIGFCTVISQNSFSHEQVSVPVNQMKKMGISFLSEHLLAFELIGFILLLVLVGASYYAKMATDE